jgi:hypothetical protein
MTPEAKREWNRAYYWRNREKRLAQQRDYDLNYRRKGIKKPRKPHQPRSIRDHERYMEHRPEILAKQKMYYDTHKEEIKLRRRKRLMKEWEKRNERREQQNTAAD